MIFVLSDSKLKPVNNRVDFSFCCISSVVGRFSGTDEWLLKTNFHPANSWTSSGLREN